MNKTNKNNGGKHESKRIHFEFTSSTADPLASETAPNPFGGVNSVRKVGNGA